MDIALRKSSSSEALDYPTQKPEALLERIIKAFRTRATSSPTSSAALAQPPPSPRNSAASGSPATSASSHPHHRKRLIGVQRELKAEGKNYRAFEILNLGKYERQAYDVNRTAHAEAEGQALAEKEASSST